MARLRRSDGVWHCEESDVEMRYDVAFDGRKRSVVYDSPAAIAEAVQRVLEQRLWHDQSPDDTGTVLVSITFRPEV